jgi:hypothetical protein
MPFTPFHLGPGALFKAIGGRRFSFMIFGGSQVLMDIEPLVRMIRGDSVVHGPSHTLLGALVIGVVSGIAGRPITKMALRLGRVDASMLTWNVAFLSAFIGTYSHIALDAVMHPDMNPLWPISAGNRMLGLISVGWLHVLCVSSALAAFVIMLIRDNRSRS